MSDFKSNYDKWPFIRVHGHKDAAVEGWDAICERLASAINLLTAPKKIIVLECYQGILDKEVLSAIKSKFHGKFYYAKDFMRPDDAIQRMIYPDVTDDETFGYITRLHLSDFFNMGKIEELKKEINSAENDTVFLYGIGASLLFPKRDLLVYFDMPRWELQLRFRRDEVSTLGHANKTLKASLQYKQAFFVDWRVLDKHKKTLMHHWDFVVDSTVAGNPKMVSGKAFNDALSQVVTQPFRFVPFFDPGPWGGQWMKKYCDLDKSVKNFAWCFDCVPEENSLLLKFDNVIIETPAINLVFQQGVKLLGDPVRARFGDEFPIRFDFLDTMEGGNLSLQVHPHTQYIREHFGMEYTQDESYYFLDAADGACVYLGLQENVVPGEMIDALRESNKNGTDFDAEKFVKKWPVRKHDHVLIPAGTIHCSGKNSMVLEISSTPYIFTFKLWDWGRMGLDDKPRPINIEHGRQNINWGLTPEITKKELINVVSPISQGDGWCEEKTGLHRREFIETRRHWFTNTVIHDTQNIVNVLNLVEGDEIIVESPTKEFEPFVVHYAETFVIPAQIGTYAIRPQGKSVGKQCATVKAFVRTNP